MADELEQQIREEFCSVFSEQHPNSPSPTLLNDSVLLETGLDSLGFAVLVVRLEERLGYDPFLLSTEVFYPKTFEEFVNFYRANGPK